MAPKAKPKAKSAAAKASTRPQPKAKAALVKRKSSADATPVKRKNSKEPEPAPSPKLAKRGSAESPASARKAMKSGGGRPVDRGIPGREAYTVYEDYSTKLNQTNIGGNNNKFYVIQVLTKGGSYWAWNRWGRVGEDGQNKLEPHGTNVANAIKSFESKFRDKSANAWSARGSFVAKSGKYTLVEMEEEEDAGGGEAAPLGKLSKAQIEKGMLVLKKIDSAISGKANRTTLEGLSSNFFSVIPTNFGRRVPEPILAEAQLREKEELLKFWLRMGFEDTKVDDGLAPISGIMDLPLPATLQAAAGAITNKGAITSATAEGEKLAKKQAGKPSSSMGAALYACIMLYTSNAIYAALNETLRNKNRAALKKFFPYLRLFFESLATLPEKKCTLWRGIPVDLYDQYPVGSTQTWWNVSSCTADVNVAKNFMKGCGGKCTLLTVEAKTACDISAITFYANEKESLLAPGTQLKVKSAKRNGNITEITLVEVGRVVK